MTACAMLAVLNMKTNDIQQCLSGFTTIEVIGGPLVVRVHKAKDVIYVGTNRCGYFISVDFKFRQMDALNIGKMGWSGYSKSEAVKEAKALAAKIYSHWSAMKAAQEQALNWDTFTNRYTAKIQSERFNKLVSKYCCGVETE